MGIRPPAYVYTHMHACTHGHTLQLDNTGTLSAMYETKLASGEKLAGSCQLKATDLSAPVKYGFAVDLS